METTGLTTTITSQAAISRIVNAAFEQSAPLIITPKKNSKTEKYLAVISRIEDENNQLILHQLLPAESGEWQELLQNPDDLDIACYMPQGAINFRGSLAPIDESGITKYYRLSLPKLLIKTQLRSGFRVPVGRFESEASIKLNGGSEVFGTCKDLSQEGALFQLTTDDIKIELNRDVNQFRLVIEGSLDLSCPAKVCHIQKALVKNELLVGVNFQELEPTQLDSIRTALIKLERLNITK